MGGLRDDIVENLKDNRKKKYMDAIRRLSYINTKTTGLSKENSELDVEEIGSLYLEIKERMKKKIILENFLTKLADLFDIGIEYNKYNKENGISDLNISVKDVLDFIRGYDKILEQNPRELIPNVFTIIDNLDWTNPEKTRCICLNIPQIYDMRTETLRKKLSFLSEVRIVFNSQESISLAEYILFNKPKDLKYGLEKIYARIMYICRDRQKVITERDYNDCFKLTDIQFETKKGPDTSIDKLKSLFPLPPELQYRVVRNVPPQGDDDCRYR